MNQRLTVKSGLYKELLHVASGELANQLRGKYRPAPPKAAESSKATEDDPLGGLSESELAALSVGS